VAEARRDSRLKGLEEDVYRIGLERRFLTVADEFSDQLVSEIEVRSGVAGSGV